MKTQKITTAIKNFATKEFNKKTLVNQMIENVLNNGERLLRPVYSQGSSWKYSSLIDISNSVELALKSLDIEFETGNDSPRGGKTGYFIKITTTFYL